RRPVLSDQHAAGHTALPGGTEGRAHHGFEGHVQIGVGKDDQMIFGAAEGLDPLTVGGRFPVNRRGHRLRTHKGNGAHLRVLQQTGRRLPASVDDVENALRQPRLQQQLGQQHGGPGRPLAGLQHKSVAARNRYRKHTFSAIRQQNFSGASFKPSLRSRQPSFTSEFSPQRRAFRARHGRRRPTQGGDPLESTVYLIFVDGLRADFGKRYFNGLNRWLEEGKAAYTKLRSGLPSDSRPSYALIATGVDGSVNTITSNGSRQRCPV